MKRLNFGCGSIQPHNWVNVDLEDHGQEHVGSTELFADDTFDVIVAHCSLQMVDYNDVPAVLAGLYRVLKPGGVLRVSLPSIIRGFAAYVDGDIGWFPNGEATIDDRFSNWLTWYSTTRSLWTMQAIVCRLLEAGFARVNFKPFGESSFSGATELDTREGECFFHEAIK